MSFLNSIDTVTREKLTCFVDLIVEWNPSINLTGFKTRRDIEEKLIGESLQAGHALNLKSERILDIGSGAGIPGLVWAIAFPHCSITSIEIRAKKHAFQKELLRQTAARAELICGRFPEGIPGRKFDLITTRAVRLSRDLWEIAFQMLEKDGCFVYFGKDSDPPGRDWHSIPVSDRSCLWVRTVS